MKLKRTAIIMTSVVILAGIAMVSPMFFQPIASNAPRQVMLAFVVSEEDNATLWSRDVASLLKAQDAPAALFITGKTAEHSQQIISDFSEKVDIGSMTYSNQDLTLIPDYLVKLREVRDGKLAIDAAGNLYSRLFRAPFGSTDQDIFSLLSRSGIVADFSYDDAYNLYKNGQFIRYPAEVYHAGDYTAVYFQALSQKGAPVIILMNPGIPVPGIEDLVKQIKANGMKLVNASELAGFTLTTRGTNNVN